MSTKTKSCVRKGDWAHYVTCNECDMHRTCTHEMNDGRIGRLFESIVVWWYRKRANKRLKRMFRGVTHRQVKRIIYFNKSRKRKK